MIFINAIGLAWAYCAPPGAVAAETIRRGLARGYWVALVVQLASLFGDTVWLLLGLGGVAILSQWLWLRNLLGFGGVLLLGYMAFVAGRAAWRRELPQLATDSQRPSSLRQDALVGAALSLSNPYALGFWLSVGVGLVPSQTSGSHWQHYALFIAGFEFGALLWCFIFAGLVLLGRRVLTPGFFQVVNGLSALLMAGFALHLLWQLMQSQPS